MKTIAFIKEGHIYIEYDKLYLESSNELVETETIFLNSLKEVDEINSRESRVLTSVTTAIKNVEQDGERISNIDELLKNPYLAEKIKEAGQKGDAIHWFLENRDNAEIGVMHEAIQPKCRQGLLFLDDYKVESIEKEFIVFEDDNAGMVDERARITGEFKIGRKKINLENEEVLIDWKSGSKITPANKIQMGAYLKMHGGCKYGILVHLRDSDYEAVIVDSEKYIGYWEEVKKKCNNPDYIIDIKSMISEAISIDIELDTRLAKLTKKKKDVESDIELVKNQIVEALGGAKGKGSFSSVSRSKDSYKIDVEKIKAYKPELAEKHKLNTYHGSIDFEGLKEKYGDDIMEFLKVEKTGESYNEEMIEKELTLEERNKWKRLARRGSYSFRVKDFTEE